MTLHPDGSAYESLSLLVENPSPPYDQPTPDPKAGYDTRWLGTSISVFLPTHTQLGVVTADGKTLIGASLEEPTTALRGVVDRPLLRHSWLLAPHQSGS